MVVISVLRAVHCRTAGCGCGCGGCGGGGVVGPRTATCSRTARVLALESHLGRFRTSIALNSGRVSAQLFGGISIWRDTLYIGVHVK